MGIFSKLKEAVPKEGDFRIAVYPILCDEVGSADITDSLHCDR